MSLDIKTTAITGVVAGAVGAVILAALVQFKVIGVDGKIDSLPPQGLVQSGIVEAGQDFELAWPNRRAPRACIKIPASTIGSDSGKVAPGTEITIGLVTGSPEPQDHPLPFHGRKVFPPIIDFSANPSFTITDSRDFFTMGICAWYHHSEIDSFEKARLAHPVSGTLVFLDRDTPCPLRCEVDPTASTTSYLQQLFGGSPLSATPLYANPREGGLGGRGGSLSPFAAVVP